MSELRPYQHDCINAILTAFREGQRKQLVVLPTGTGKTIIFSELLRRARGRRLCLVHRDELVRQTVEKLTRAGCTSVGVIKAAEDETHADIVVASVQTLSRDRRLFAYAAAGKPQTIVVDEAHHAPAPSYRKVIEFLEPKLLVGVTATPDRETYEDFTTPTGGHKLKLRAGMAKVFDTVVYFRQLSDMVAEGWLCDIVPATVETDLHLSDVKDTAGDWDAEEIGHQLEESEADQQIVNEWLRCAEERPTIVFLPTVATSRLTCMTFNQAGIPAAHIDGTTPTEERQAIYSQLRAGKLKVLCNCMVLTEGFDEPSISCVIVARPTKSRALFAQMIGRGTRLYPNKTDCLVMSVVSHELDLNPITLQEFMNDPGWDDGQPMVKRKRQLAESREAASAEAQEEAIRFINQFTVKPVASQLIWRKQGDRWLLLAGEHKVVVTPGPENTFTAMAYTPVSEEPLNGVTSLENAVSLAERWIKDHGAATLVNPNANWRKHKPSDKQLLFAKKLGLADSAAATMSKGELSEWISSALLNQPKPNRRK